jgi:hypothetical protein
MKLFISLSMFLTLCACGKSSDSNIYFPVPKTTDPTTPEIITPTPSESSKIYNFPNYNDESDLKSKTYSFSQAVTIKLPLKITTNSLNTPQIYVVFNAFFCTYIKTNTNEYTNSNCLSDLMLAANDLVYVYGIPFGSIVSINLSFK